MTTVTRRRLLAAGLAAPLPLATPIAGAADAARPEAWARIEQAARGQTVRFNAWAGSDRINAYLQWVAAEVERQHGVRLQHVRIADTAEVVRRVRAEKAAGRADGSADLVWINGENFLALKREGLLFGPWSEALPNYRLVDVQGKPTTRVDFSEPVEGFEAAWGMAQLTFFADGARVPQPPRSLAALLAWARGQPGRFTYPRPPDFHGTTFVKQALADLAPDRAVLYRPHGDAAFAAATAPLWAWLGQLHPLLWRAGRQFPPSQAAMRQMLADGELWIALTFNPNEAASEVAARRLPASVVSFQFAGGTLGNTHFVAIPFNASSKEGAQVVANFLQSPAAQARKADIRHWGDPTVLALDRLGAEQRAAFAEAGGAPGAVREPALAIPEPHASWVEPLEREWLRRFGTG
jgi:putative thiamine transport system substrate-binding protein